MRSPSSTLFATGDDVNVEPGVGPQASHEDALVARLAGGRRGHGDDLFGAVAAGEPGKRAADEHGALDGRRAQQMVGELLFTKAHDLALQVDHVIGAVGRDPHEHEAHRIGADVDETDDLAVAAGAAVAVAVSYGDHVVYTLSPNDSVS